MEREKANKQRIKDGIGWVEIEHDVDKKYKVEMLREKINIWKPRPKDRILRITKLEEDAQKENSTQTNSSEEKEQYSNPKGSTPKNEYPKEETGN